MRVDGLAAVLMDPRTGTFLYEREPALRRAPASLAKMVTALVVADRLKPDDTLTISRNAATAEADQIRWPQGATFTVDQVMHGMLMTSSNGAAIALAERVAGSVKAFRPMMNLRAARAGATDTVIVDPSGLDAAGQHSTAHDLAFIARDVLASPWLRSVVATLQFVVPWPNGTTVIVHSIDKFLLRYPGAIGVKNGYTTQAQNNLAAAATRHGVTLIAVALGSPSAYDDASRLMDLGFRLVPAAGAAPVVEPQPTQRDEAVESTISPTPTARSETPAEAVSARRSHLMRWLFLFGAIGYVARVVQVKRRRAARRRARARLAARRRMDHTLARSGVPGTPAFPPADLGEERRTRTARAR